jgi:transcriptional regulator with XRE-family HTH domain
MTTQHKTRAIKAALTCRELAISQAQIAAAVGASQSQVSRILSGRGSRPTRLLEEVCLYVERFETGVSAEAVRGNEDMVHALTQIWDGTAQHARAISTVIQSLALIRGPRIQR